MHSIIVIYYSYHVYGKVIFLKLITKDCVYIKRVLGPLVKGCLFVIIFSTFLSFWVVLVFFFSDDATCCFDIVDIPLCSFNICRWHWLILRVTKIFTGYAHNFYQIDYTILWTEIAVPLINSTSH